MDISNDHIVTLICPIQKSFKISYNATSISCKIRAKMARFNNDRLVNIPVPASIMRDLTGWMEHFHFESVTLNFAPDAKNVVFDGITLYDRHFIAGSFAKLIKFHLAAIYLKIYRLQFVVEILLREKNIVVNLASFDMLYDSLSAEDRQEILFLRLFALEKM